jgi:hypothetical protein
MAYDIEQLLKMTTPELDALFTSAPVGDIPDGEGKGTAIIGAGTVFTHAIASFINHFAWQGKVFDAKAGLLRNLITPLACARSSRRSTRARVGSTARNASSWIIRKLRSLPAGSAMKSA